MKSQIPSKFGKLSWIGLALAISFPFTSIIAFALVATVIGEDKLEKPYPGEATGLGYFVTVLPILLGLILVVFDLIFQPVLTNIWKGVLASGLFIGTVGIISVITLPAEQGANIGGGLLILTGLVLLVIGLVMMVAKRRIDG